MKVERWEEETNEEWAERLAEQIAIANNTETTKYFVNRDPYAEENFIINYIGKDDWTWKDHPEGPFSCKQALEWKNKAEQWGKVSTAMKKTVADMESQSHPANIAQIVVHRVLSAYLQAMGEEVQGSTQTARDNNES